jgi:hypothetical protein
MQHHKLKRRRHSALRIQHPARANSGKITRHRPSAWPPACPIAKTPDFRQSVEHFSIIATRKGISARSKLRQAIATVPAGQGILQEDELPASKGISSALGSGSVDKLRMKS